MAFKADYRFVQGFLLFSFRLSSLLRNPNPYFAAGDTFVDIGSELVSSIENGKNCFAAAPILPRFRANGRSREFTTSVNRGITPKEPHKASLGVIFGFA